MKTIIFPSVNAREHRWFWNVLLVITLGCAWLGLSSVGQATDLGSVVPNFNTADGSGVLTALTTGAQNTGIGYQALNHDNSGNYNTAEGFHSLYSNTTGGANTAIGTNALLSNTSGSNNTATGINALRLNTTATANTANGAGALYHNTASSNTATGYQALFGNTTGIQNTANGVSALSKNTTGQNNTAVGHAALASNTDGSDSTAVGFLALAKNTTISGVIGSGNTAVGYQSLFNNTTGGNNIALGSQAGINHTAGDDNIYVGAPGVNENSTIRIGDGQSATYIAGIKDHFFSMGTIAPVYVDTSSDRLGIVMPASSERFKDDIKPMAKASEAILALNPVTFHYKKEIDPHRTAQFGLVAEEVEKINPDLITRDRDGKPYGVRYEAVNAMLLNEFLKGHRTVEQLKKEIAVLTATVKEQASQIQKVTAQLEASKPEPKIVSSQ